jgi:hypothetical protein
VEEAETETARESAKGKKAVEAIEKDNPFDKDRAEVFCYHNLTINHTRRLHNDLVKLCARRLGTRA